MDMKKRFLLLILLLGSFLFTVKAQVVMTLSSTNETCENNGSITVDVTGLKSGDDILSLALKKNGAVIEDITGLPPVTGTTFQYVFTAKNSGTYTVALRIDHDGTTVTDEKNVSIGNNVEPLGLSPTVEFPCSGAIIKANVTAGRPVEYRLLKPDNTPMVNWQPSDIITVPTFTDGGYKLQVKDDCGQIKVVGLTLKNPPAPQYGVRRTKPAEQFRFLSDCNHFYHIETLIDNSSPGYPTVQEARYPVQVKIEVENPNGGAATVINSTWDGTPNTGHHINGQYNKCSEAFNIPYYPGETYEYKVTFTDVCGKVFTHNEQITGKTDLSKLVNLPAACGENGLATGWLYDVLAAPVTVTFTEAPAGFKPSEYNTHFTGSNVSAVFPENIVELTLPRYEFTKITNGGGVPPGKYTIKFEACGKTWTKSTIIPAADPVVLKKKVNLYGCGADRGAVQLWSGIPSQLVQNDDIATIEFTKAPPAFVAEYGAVPYDASANVAPAPDYYKGRFFMNSLPPGEYEVKVTTVKCGKTLTDSFTIKERELDKKITVSRKCGGNFDIKIDVTTNVWYETFFLQKWYEDANKWGDPFNAGKLQNGSFDKDKAYQMGDRDPGGRNEFTTYSREALNLNGLGKFRIIMTQGTYGNGKSYIYDACPEVVEEFEVKELALKIDNYNVLKCASSGKATLLVEVSGGVPPLKYKIVKINGVPTSAYPQTTEPAWSNLADGTYAVEIEDKCGNTRTVDFAVNKSRPPLIKSKNLCDGQNGKIYLEGAGFLTIKWFKDGADTGKEGVEFPFTPFDSSTDAGLYEARLYFPSSNAEVCNEPIILDLRTITSTVEAGDGQQNVPICVGKVDFVNLFDYVTPPYNNWGDWTDPEDTGALNGSTLDVKAFFNVKGEGTYTFNYNVKGHCTGQDNTSVTLILRSQPKFKLEKEDAVCNDQKSKVKVIITSDAGTYVVNLYKSADATGAVVATKTVTTTATSTEEQKTVTFEVEESATYSVKVLNGSCTADCGE